MVRDDWLPPACAGHPLELSSGGAAGAGDVGRSYLVYWLLITISAGSELSFLALALFYDQKLVFVYCWCFTLAGDNDLEECWSFDLLPGALSWVKCSSQHIRALAPQSERIVCVLTRNETFKVWACLTNFVLEFSCLF